MDAERTVFVEKLFPSGIPALWSPMLTPFRSARRIDRVRFEAHLRFLAPHVGGILVPGSTGEGWDMDDPLVRRLLGYALDVAPGLGVRVLIGVLKRDSAAAHAVILEKAAWLCRRTGVRDPLEAMVAAGVSGFTVCPPHGRHLKQPQIEAALGGILETGLPMALYQLPQVTENEMSAGTVERLARRFPNLILFKDTSGTDRVANSGKDLHGVCTVRGAEGRYASWTRDGGGPYDGLLLSTTNPFAPQLARMLRLLAQGRKAEAVHLAERIESVVTGAFAAVSGFEDGNPFANANKILEHWMAHGPEGKSAPAPRLISGRRLPAELLEAGRLLLAGGRLLPKRGYLS